MEARGRLGKWPVQPLLPSSQRRYYTRFLYVHTDCTVPGSMGIIVSHDGVEFGTYVPPLHGPILYLAIFLAAEWVPWCIFWDFHIRIRIYIHIVTDLGTFGAEIVNSVRGIHSPSKL